METFLLTIVFDESRSQDAAVQEKQDQEMASEDINTDVADTDALECRLKPDGVVNMSLSGEMVSIV